MRNPRVMDAKLARQYDVVYILPTPVFTTLAPLKLRTGTVDKVRVTYHRPGKRRGRDAMQRAYDRQSWRGSVPMLAQPGQKYR